MHTSEFAARARNTCNPAICCQSTHRQCKHTSMVCRTFKQMLSSNDCSTSAHGCYGLMHSCILRCPQQLLTMHIRYPSLLKPPYSGSKSQQATQLS
jgi:hypothetical protein